ncbi:tyrosine-protein phosphatase [Mesorhizobium kowhaii]|uniref:tyrosine-protein phosphatase n=1 Tax=Mesorhizobium kowhaii TaxID=1300272 RepID=UPI0035E6C84F
MFATVGVIAFAGCALAATHLNDNFHPIVERRVYRSAQPTGDEIRAYRDEYHIAAIINLRGEARGRSWYDEEVKTTRELGIRHIDFAMSARRKLTQDQSLALIALMKSAPKPLLIHCQAGSDRSGLAAALYLAALEKAGEEKSEAQLSIRFGHIAIPLLGTYEMDQSFEAMEPLLGFSGS